MKKALLIIDLQQVFNPPPDMVEGFKTKAKDYEIVVATRFMSGNPLYQSVLKYPGLSEEESSLATLPAHAKVFEKTGYGLPPDLLSYLKSKEVSEVDVGGLRTDACVLAAMFDLWDAAIRPVLLEELSATLDKNGYEAAVLVAKRNFGT